MEQNSNITALSMKPLDKENNWAYDNTFEDSEHEAYESKNETNLDRKPDNIRGNTDEIYATNLTIWKSILSMGAVFMLIYTSYSGLSSLSSSLHIQEGMGTICASVRYVSLVISSLFVPKLMIAYIGHKWTVCVSLLGFILWMAANGYAVWATMIPASIVNGIFVAPLWAAQGAYFTYMGQEYAAANGYSTENTVTLFFGIFYMFYLASGIFGNIISTTVLKSAPPENYTEPDEDFVSENCGINDCPWNTLNNTNLEPMPDHLVWTLCGIYIAIAIVAVIISATLVEQLPVKYSEKSSSKHGVFREIKRAFIDTMKLVKYKQMILLIPMTFYVGLEETYFFSEFNRSWITCAIGIWMIGIMNIPFAITGTCGSVILGKIVDYTGRIPPVLTALAIDIILQLTLVFWTIDPNETHPFYLVSTFWGISDAIWITITTALYGIMFPTQSDAAFSQYMLWQCAGYAFAYGYSYFGCSNIKLIVLHFFLWFGVICYFVLEKFQKNETLNTLKLEDKAEKQ